MKSSIAILTLAAACCAATCGYEPQEFETEHPDIPGCFAPKKEGLIGFGVLEQGSCPERQTFTLWTVTTRWIPLSSTECVWAAERRDMWPASQDVPSPAQNDPPVVHYPLVPIYTEAFGTLQCSVPAQYGVLHGNTGCTYVWTLCETP